MFDTIYVIRLILNHLKNKIKFLGLDIEVKNKEKSAQSSQD